MNINGGFALCGTQAGLQPGCAISAVIVAKKEKETHEVFDGVKPHNKYPQ